MPKKDLYHSKAWEDTRRAYALKQNCLCERCGRPVYINGITKWMPKEKRLLSIVHHKEYLSEENYGIDAIALDENNLELLCIDCHNQEHQSAHWRRTNKRKTVIRKGMKFDENGMPTTIDSSPR